jgi:hypothetical protein
MVTTRRKSFQHYVDRIERHLRKKYPDLSFALVMKDDREGTIFYSPDRDEDGWDIVHRTSRIAIEALIRDDYTIHIQPS